MHILIVGRHQQVVDNLLNSLREEGYRVEGTILDEEAITSIRLHIFDVVVLAAGLKLDSRVRIKAACLDKSHPPRAIDFYTIPGLLEQLHELRSRD